MQVDVELRASKLLAFATILLFLLVLQVSMQPASAAKQTVKVSILDRWDGASTLYITVKVQGNLPSSITIRLESGFKTQGKGFAIFDIQRVTLLDLHGNLAEFTFAVPFQGAGQYKFAAFVYDPAGKLIGKALIEPREGTGP